MIRIHEFIERFYDLLHESQTLLPWEITGMINSILLKFISDVSSDYIIKNEIALHNSAIVEEGAVIKGPAFISEDCFIGTGAYIRGGVLLCKNVIIGPGCEIKSSIIFPQTRIAHFNFIGDSIIGNDVNFEAGAVVANHFNERKDKSISVRYKDEIIKTGVKKFGALIGDHSRIGANAVLTPGTILGKNSVIRRLELVEQIK